jgi:hypothetical protein
VEFLGSDVAKHGWTCPLCGRVTKMAITGAPIRVWAGHGARQPPFGRLTGPQGQQVTAESFDRLVRAIAGREAFMRRATANLALAAAEAKVRDLKAEHTGERVVACPKCGGLATLDTFEMSQGANARDEQFAQIKEQPMFWYCHWCSEPSRASFEGLILWRKYGTAPRA